MSKQTGYAGTAAALAARVVLRTLFFGLLWWVLSEGGSPLNPLGIVAAAGAVWLSLHLSPSSLWGWNFRALGRFAVFFVWQSLLGGLDVAIRALKPNSRVQPVVIHHRFKGAHEGTRVFFLLVVSLLPGTAAVDLEGDTATVHVLDESLAGSEALEELERRIIALAGSGSA